MSDSLQTYELQHARPPCPTHYLLAIDTYIYIYTHIYTHTHLKMRHIFRDKYIFKSMSKYFLSIDSITLTSHLCRNKNDFERTSMWLTALIVSAISFSQAINTICLSPGKQDGHTPPPRVFVIPPMPSCTKTSCTQTSASCFNNCYFL